LVRVAIEENEGQGNREQQSAEQGRHRTQGLSPVIVFEILAVMIVAGIGVAFTSSPRAPGRNATPTPAPTNIIIQDVLEFVPPSTIVYNAANTQITGVAIRVHNKDTIVHSGTVQVAVDHEGQTITGNSSFTDLAADATVQVTVTIGPVTIGTSLSNWRITVVPTS